MTKTKKIKPPQFRSPLVYNKDIASKAKSLIKNLRQYYGFAIKFFDDHRIGASEKAYIELEEQTVELYAESILPRNLQPQSLRYAIGKLKMQYAKHESGSVHPRETFNKCKDWTHITYPISSCIVDPETRSIWITGLGKIKTKEKLNVPVNASKVTLYVEGESMRIVITGFYQS